MHQRAQMTLKRYAIHLLLILLFHITQMDVRNRQEEIAYLRTSMSRLREELDQQRRLNVCLKERKVLLECKELQKNYTAWQV